MGVEPTEVLPPPAFETGCLASSYASDLLLSYRDETSSVIHYFTLPLDERCYIFRWDVTYVNICDTLLRFSPDVLRVHREPDDTVTSRTLVLVLTRSVYHHPGWVVFRIAARVEPLVARIDVSDLTCWHYVCFSEEAEGVEPPDPFEPPAFKAGVISHSTTLPLFYFLCFLFFLPLAVGFLCGWYASG